LPNFEVFHATVSYAIGPGGFRGIARSAGLHGVPFLQVRYVMLGSFSSDAVRSEMTARWIVGFNRLGPSGSSMVIAPLWGIPFGVNSGSSTSLVAASIAPDVTGSKVQIIRISKLFCRISEGDTPAVPTLTSTSFPGFVGAGVGVVTLNYPAQTWTTVIPNTVSLFSGAGGANISFPTVTFSTPVTNVTPSASYALPSFQLAAGGVACSFPITSGFRLDVLGNLQVGSTGPFTPVVWNPTTGTTGVITLAPTANVTPPQWQIGALSFTQNPYVAALSGGWNTVPVGPQITTEPAFTVTGGFTGDSYVASGGLVLISPVTPVRVQINISLYIARFNTGTGLWSVKDPLANVLDVVYDYLDLVVDNYVPSFGSGSPDSGRLWEVCLRNPVVIEAGEALIITVSQSNSGNGFRTYVPYVRALVSDLA